MGPNVWSRVSEDEKIPRWAAVSLIAQSSDTKKKNLSPGLPDVSEEKHKSCNKPRGVIFVCVCV